MFNVVKATSKGCSDEQFATWQQIASAYNEGGLFKQYRTAKQCRERWITYVNPAILIQKMSQNEVEIIFAKWKQYGNSWVKIAEALPGRGDNAIKNIFNSSLRKYQRRLRRIISQSCYANLFSQSDIVISSVKTILIQELTTHQELEAFCNPPLKKKLVEEMDRTLSSSEYSFSTLPFEEKLAAVVSAVNLSIRKIKTMTNEEEHRQRPRK